MYTNKDNNNKAPAITLSGDSQLKEAITLSQK
jgi:hypothetical protein